ncbi:hypothetical protein FRC17_006899 [Serendipita sp. 399]|nr:hypothetical protein FRC17_006899 [Serendipita sp. 399]
MAATAYTDEWVTVAPNVKVFARYQSPKDPKGAVVFVHGYIEHLGRYDFVREHLVSKGFAVLFYDQRGFGQSALNTENRSPGSGYGRNSREELLNDVQFMLNYAREKFKTENLFLYGHSMGGAISLQYGCIGKDDLKVKQHLRGIVATSPLIRLSDAAPVWQLKAGLLASKIMPWMMVSTPVNAKALTQDEAIVKAYLADPLVIERGTLRGVGTMLQGGIDLAERHFRQWPENLPVTLFHGSVDKVNSCQATQKFHDDINATDKSYYVIEGGLHELHNEPAFKEKLLADITSWLLSHLPSPSAKKVGEAPVDHAPIQPDPPVAGETSQEAAAAKL